MFVEGFLFYGAFTFIGAWLRARFGLDYAMIGVVLGCFGLGGLVYALTVRRLMDRLGERGLALGGGAILTLGFLAVAWGSLALMAPAIAALGLGMYMLHATLQTNATQMAPEARGLAVSTFANALFLGQAAGVWLAGLAVDRIGFPPVFAVMGVALAGLGRGLCASARPPPGRSLSAVISLFRFLATELQGSARSGRNRDDVDPGAGTGDARLERA